MMTVIRKGAGRCTLLPVLVAAKKRTGGELREIPEGSAETSERIHLIGDSVK